MADLIHMMRWTKENEPLHVVFRTAVFCSSHNFSAVKPGQKETELKKESFAHFIMHIVFRDVHRAGKEAFLTDRANPRMFLFRWHSFPRKGRYVRRQNQKSRFRGVCRRQTAWKRLYQTGEKRDQDFPAAFLARGGTTRITSTFSVMLAMRSDFAESRAWRMAFLKA